MGKTIRLDYPRTHEINIPSSVAPEDESFYVAIAEWEYRYWLHQSLAAERIELAKKVWQLPQRFIPPILQIFRSKSS